MFRPTASHGPGKRVELSCGGRVQEDVAGVPDRVRERSSAPEVHIQRRHASPEEPHI